MSVFSQVSAVFDLGFERAGGETILQVELDSFCQKVLAKHWPHVRRISDVHEVTAADCEGADVIFGGFPCQPVSTAGQRRGVDDDRWLWPQFARVVSAVRPPYVVVENVAGLLTANGGRAFGEVIGDLAALGYDAEWQCIPAAALGAPHLRYRLFIVSHSRSLRRESTGFEEPELEHDEVRRGEQPVGTRARWAATDNGPRRREQEERHVRTRQQHADRCSEIAANAHAQGEIQPERFIFEVGQRPSDSRWWESEPAVERVVYGVPAAVDRIAALGNAVVPQVAEYVFNRLFEFDRMMKEQ